MHRYCSGARSSPHSRVHNTGILKLACKWPSDNISGPWLLVDNAGDMEVLFGSSTSSPLKIEQQSTAALVS
jgi:hypothetical protein